jgi:hypothetical protein
MPPTSIFSAELRRYFSAMHGITGSWDETSFRKDAFVATVEKNSSVASGEVSFSHERFHSLV